MRSFRPHEHPPDRCVTGPHVVVDEDAEPQLIYRCELCDFESVDPMLLRGCHNCDGGVLWR